MNNYPFVEASHSTASRHFVEECTDKLEACDRFEDEDLDDIFDSNSHELLDKLANLADAFPSGNPFKPILLPGM